MFGSVPVSVFSSFLNYILVPILNGLCVHYFLITFLLIFVGEKALFLQSFSCQDGRIRLQEANRGPGGPAHGEALEEALPLLHGHVGHHTTPVQVPYYSLTHSTPGFRILDP